MNALCHVSGFSSALPSRILTNQDLERIVDTSDQWIRERTGIASRHVLADNEMPLDLAITAGRRTLELSGCSPETITHVVACTCTPQYLCPSTAAVVAHELGLGHVPAFDVNAACSGFLYGLDVSRGLICSNENAHILLVAVEGLTRRVNWKDRGTCVLFGDGAGAVVVGKDLPATAHTAVLEDVSCQADAGAWRCLTVGGGSVRRYISGETVVDDDFFIKMDGRDVFRHAVRNMVAISKNLVARNGLSLDDISLLIPHQANLRIIEAVRSRLNLPEEAVMVNIADHGNTSAASIPMALSDACAAGRLQPGKRALLVAFGGGFTWAAALLKFC